MNEFSIIETQGEEIVLEHLDSQSMFVVDQDNAQELVDLLDEHFSVSTQYERKLTNVLDKLPIDIDELVGENY